MGNDARFWDRLADRYSKQPVANEAAYQEKLARTRSYFRPDMELLEFGCGTGTTAVTHAPHVHHILATDISERMLEIGRERASAANVSNITFEHTDFSGIDDTPDRFDMVLGLSILHLLEDRNEAIRKVHNVLKPGGLFVSSTVCLGGKMSVFKIIAPIGRLFGLMPLLRIFTSAQLVQSLTEAGFEIEDEWQPEKAMSVFIVARKV